MTRLQSTPSSLSSGVDPRNQVQSLANKQTKTPYFGVMLYLPFFKYITKNVPRKNIYVKEEA